MKYGLRLWEWEIAGVESCLLGIRPISTKEGHPPSALTRRPGYAYLLNIGFDSVTVSITGCDPVGGSSILSRSPFNQNLINLTY